MLSQRVLDKLNRGCAADQHMVVVWSIRNGRVHMDRICQDFPFSDVDTALNLLEEALNYDKQQALPAKPESKV